MARRTRRRSRVSRKASRKSRRKTRRRRKHNMAPPAAPPAAPVMEGGKKKRRRRSGGKRKMNAFMVAKEKARKGGDASFQYKGKTYHKKKTKTGMVIYSRKK